MPSEEWLGIKGVEGQQWLVIIGYERPLVRLGEKMRREGRGSQVAKKSDDRASKGGGS